MTSGKLKTTTNWAVSIAMPNASQIQRRVVWQDSDFDFAPNNEPARVSIGCPG